ncbi:MAG TPA: NADP-dependent oxidoreductase [Steroidobacteraceae bacterium]|nr:NADP-dependent oxidoreductase [Steroidobacteraceae bacterium]
MARSLALLVLFALSLRPLVVWADGGESMKAMVLTDGHLVLQSVPKPAPGPGEVRIKIRAAAINPADWKMTRMASRWGPEAILGLDASGVIDAVGPAVSGWQRGDAVIALTRPPHGAYAQYVVVPVDFVAPKPRALSFDEAAGIPVAGITAWRSLVDVAHLRKGQRVLIDGGAGGVGSAAVQIAKAQGAYVIATASASNAPFLRSIGADEVIDYRAGPFEQKVKDVDVVLDTVNRDDGIRAISTLKAGGVLVSVVGAMPQEQCAAARILCTAPGSSGGQPAAPYLRHIATLADTGQYHVNVERVFPLSRAQDAWELNRQGHTRGKLILSLAD